MGTAPIILALALAALSGASAAAAERRESQADPILVAHADGSWTIARAIGEEPVALETATRGLLADGKAEDERAMREAEADEAVERAFEEAINQARRQEPPQ